MVGRRGGLEPGGRGEMLVGCDDEEVGGVEEGDTIFDN